MNILYKVDKYIGVSLTHGLNAIQTSHDTSTIGVILLGLRYPLRITFAAVENMTFMDS